MSLFKITLKNSVLSKKKKNLILSLFQNVLLGFFIESEKKKSFLNFLLDELIFA